jgi:hypothetical protein
MEMLFWACILGLFVVPIAVVRHARREGAGCFGCVSGAVVEFVLLGVASWLFTQSSEWVVEDCGRYGNPSACEFRLYSPDYPKATAGRAFVLHFEAYCEPPLRGSIGGRIFSRDKYRSWEWRVVEASQKARKHGCEVQYPFDYPYR